MQPNPMGPLFLYAHHTLLLYKDLRSVIRAWAFENGIQLNKFGTHSARSGSATTAFKAGADSSAIMLLGDWLSSTFLGYLRQSTLDVHKIQMDMVDQLKAQLRIL